MKPACRSIRGFKCNQPARALLAAFLVGGGASLQAAQPPVKPQEKAAYKIISPRAEIIFKSQWQLTSRLLKTLMEEKPEANLLIAPDSLSRSMRLVALGARGETLAQLESLFPETQQSDFQIESEPDLVPVLKWAPGFSASGNGGYGLLVNQVEPDSPVAKAGLAVNDAIININGTPTQDSRKYLELIEKSDGTLALTFYQYKTGRVVDLRIALKKAATSPPVPAVTDRRFVVVHTGQTIDEPFYQAASNTFGGVWLRHDFKSRSLADVSDWAGKPFSTQGVLKERLTTGDPDTRLLVLSEFGLKSKWRGRFDEIPKEVFTFTDTRGLSSQAPAFGAQSRVYITKTAQMEMAEIPLKEEGLSAFFLLPAGSQIQDHLAALNETVPDQTRKMTEEVVEVAIPNFKFSSDISFNTTLAKLGVRDVFTNKADLGLISKDDELKVENVLQATQIACDYSGVSAQAVTTVVFNVKGSGPDRQFRLNRPFFFFIARRESGEIYFAGRLVRP